MIPEDESEVAEARDPHMEVTSLLQGETHTLPLEHNGHHLQNHMVLHEQTRHPQVPIDIPISNLLQRLRLLGRQLQMVHLMHGNR